MSVSPEPGARQSRGNASPSPSSAPARRGNTSPSPGASPRPGNASPSPTGSPSTYGGGDSDLPEVGKVYKGKVTGTRPFGAFVRIPGFAKDGLIHISQLLPRRVETVEEVVNVDDEVFVKVQEIRDGDRISLTCKDVCQETGEEGFGKGFQNKRRSGAGQGDGSKPIVNKIYPGEVTRIAPFGAFVAIEGFQTHGLINIGQLQEERTENVEDVVSMGQNVMVKVARVEDSDRGPRISLTLKGVPQGRAGGGGGGGRYGNSRSNDRFDDRRGGSRSRYQDDDRYGSQGSRSRYEEEDRYDNRRGSSRYEDEEDDRYGKRGKNAYEDDRYDSRHPGRGRYEEQEDDRYGRPASSRSGERGRSDSQRVEAYDNKSSKKRNVDDRSRSRSPVSRGRSAASTRRDRSLSPVRERYGRTHDRSASPIRDSRMSGDDRYALSRRRASPYHDYRY